MFLLCPPCCKYLARLHLDIMCIKRKTPLDKPPFIPSPHLKVEIIEFTYCNGCFFEATIALNHTKYDVLIPHLQHLGWQSLSSLILTLRIHSTVHFSITKLHDLDIPQSKLWALLKTISLKCNQVAIWSLNMSSPNSSRTVSLMLYIPSCVHLLTYI